MRGWWTGSGEGLGAAGNIARTVASLLSVGGVLAVFGHAGLLAKALVGAGVLAGIMAILLAVMEARARRRERAAIGGHLPHVDRFRLALLFGILLLAVGAAAFVANRVGREDPALVAQGVRVVNVHPAFTGWGSDDNLMAGHQMPKTVPRLDVILYNGGARRVVTTRARFTVLKAKPLEMCGGGTGSLPVSGTYDVKLPAAPFSWSRPRGIPADRRTVEIPFPRELARDGADHVAFRIGSAPGPPTAYRLRASIEYDGGQELDLGEIVMVVPGIPKYDGLWLLARPSHLDPLWKEHLAGFPRDAAHSFLPLEYSECIRGNLRVLREMAEGGAARSPQLERLRELSPPAAFARFSSLARRPLQLIAAGRAEDAIRYAEDELDDPALARRCREVAAGRQLARARLDLSLAGEAGTWRLAHDEYLSAIRAAQNSLRFHKTVVARRLVHKVKRDDRALGITVFHWSTIYPEL